MAYEFFPIVYYFDHSYEMYMFFCFGDYTKVVWHQTMWLDKTLYILLMCFHVYSFIRYFHACILFHFIDPSNIFQACSFLSFEQVWKHWRHCVKALYIKNIGCTWNDKMYPYILSFTSKFHMWRGKIFHDKLWNIFFHHILFTCGKWIYWEYSMAWHEYSLRFFLTCVNLLTCSHEPTHPLTR